MSKFFRKIIAISIYSTVFFVPLAYAPNAFEKFEFAKHYALAFFVALGLVAWFSKMVLADKEIAFVKTPLNRLVFLFLLVGVVSTFFSADRLVSVLGSYGRFSNGLLGMLSFAGFYFLIINNVKQKDVELLVKTFFASFFLAVAASYGSLFGTHLPKNLVAESSNGFAVALGILAVMVTASLSRAWHWALLAGSFGLLAIINFSGAWVVVLFGMASSLLFFVLQRIRVGERFSFKKVWLPAVLLFISIIFLFSPKPFLSRVGISPESLPSQSASWHVSFSAAFGSIKNFFVGSGPATFQIDFSKYSAMPIQARFDRASNAISETLATQGFLELFVLGGIVFVFLLLAFIRIAYEKRQKELRYAMFFSTTVALLAAQFAYYQNTALAFVFWLVLSFGIVSFAGEESEVRISLKKFLEIALGARFLLLCAAVGVGMLYFFEFRFALADASFAKAKKSFNTQEQIANASKASMLNPYVPEYSLFVSQTYFGNVLKELEKPQTSQNQQAISQNAQGAIRFGQQAENIGHSRAVVVEALASMYASLPFVAGAQDWAIQLHKEAIALEPSNPLLYNELGKLYAAKSDLAGAKEQFEKALSLNPNFKDALLQKAFVAEKEGDSVSAIAEIKDIAARYPPDSNILFQLGRLYFNNNQLQEAAYQFQQAIAQDAGNSNAHFALGALYEKQGDVKRALEEYKKVYALNPDNKEVANKIKTLSH